MGQDEGLNYVLAMTKSLNCDDRAHAAVQLGTTEIKGSLNALVLLLGDSDVVVRFQALRAVWELHDHRAHPCRQKTP